MIRSIAAVVPVLASLGLATAIAPDMEIPPATAPGDWPMSFHDEFASLDFSRWDTCFPWGGRSMKDESQMYVDPTYAGDGSAPLGLNPFSVKDGVLTIRADRPTASLQQHLQGKAFTSGLLTSYHSFAQLYGYFEMRARMPAGRGLWPAFWLLPTDKTWPPEIDVMEALLHQPSTIYVSVHMSTRGHAADKIIFPLPVADVTKEFHTYGVRWSPSTIAWYFDGKRVAYTPTPVNVQKPMYMLVNLAVGGDWPGHPDESTSFPAAMLIDFIRAYALPKHVSLLWKAPKPRAISGSAIARG